MSVAEPTVLGRERLLQEAEKLFAEQGYAAVSIRDITAATGMSAGAIYHHFGSKEAFFFELLEVNLREVIGTLRAALEQASSTREQLRRVCELYFSRPAQKRKLFEQMFRELPRLNAERVQNFYVQVREGYFGTLEEIVREGMAQGALAPVNPRLAAVALHGILRMLASETHAGSYPSPEVRSEFALNLFFDGLGMHGTRADGPARG